MLRKDNGVTSLINVRQGGGWTKKGISKWRGCVLDTSTRWKQGISTRVEPFGLQCCQLFSGANIGALTAFKIIKKTYF